MRTLVRLRSVDLDGTRRRLAACYDVSDLRRVARRRIPRPVFDYVDGAADEELARAGNAAAFRQWRFLPRVLADVATVDTTATVFGSALPMPLALGPAGYSRMMHPDGESGAARSAARHGLPYTLSTMATTSIEELAAAVNGSGGAVKRSGGAADLWFQLYILKDRERAGDLVSRAADNGFRVLVVTVDTVVAGNRLRDHRNGLAVPPELSLRTVGSVAGKPGYWLRLLSGPAIDFANFAGQRRTTIMKSADFFDPGINWDDIASLRSRWPGKLILKGPLGPADARRAVAPADLIAPVREAVGPTVTILVDSGIRHGADVIVALALGADAGVLGRAYLYGLMAGGEAGVDRALDLLTAQFRSTMRLLGVTSVGELRKRGRELITRGAV